MKSITQSADVELYEAIDAAFEKHVALGAHHDSIVLTFFRQSRDLVLYETADEDVRLSIEQTVKDRLTDNGMLAADKHDQLVADLIAAVGVCSSKCPVVK